MVPAKQCDALGVAHLQAQQEKERFDAVVPTINVIAHEQIVGAGTVPSHEKQLSQVIELAVNITTNLLFTKGTTANRNGRMDFVHIVLLQEQLLGLVAQVLHLQLRNQLAAAKLHA